MDKTIPMFLGRQEWEGCYITSMEQLKQGFPKNNQDEVLSLWKGLKIIISKCISHLNIVGDSMVVIQKCTRSSRKMHHIDFESSPMLIRIMFLLIKLDAFNFYHVKWENNREADFQANIGTALEQGVLIIDQSNQICHVP